jgi:hypothetical protein
MCDTLLFNECSSVFVYFEIPRTYICNYNVGYHSLFRFKSEVCMDRDQRKVIVCECKLHLFFDFFSDTSDIMYISWPYGSFIFYFNGKKKFSHKYLGTNYLASLLPSCTDLHYYPWKR